MTAFWYHTPDGLAPRDPVPFEQLRELFQSGQVRHTDLVCRAGMRQWQFVGQIEELVPLPAEVAAAVPAEPPLASGADRLHEIWQELRGFFRQGAFAAEEFDDLTTILLREEAGGSSSRRSGRPAKARRRARRWAEEPVFDAVAVEVADGEEILDPIDLGADDDFDADDDGPDED